ncbi:MAG: hypothetical protein HY815_02980 [Candidatus Riflebacteria bacterium]|nr:hypothetical protein [Candidatus Riflebacteria bacterium]
MEFDGYDDPAYADPPQPPPSQKNLPWLAVGAVGVVLLLVLALSSDEPEIVVGGTRVQAQDGEGPEIVLVPASIPPELRVTRPPRVRISSPRPPTRPPTPQPTRLARLPASPRSRSPAPPLVTGRVAPRSPPPVPTGPPTPCADETRRSAGMAAYQAGNWRLAHELLCRESVCDPGDRDLAICACNASMRAFSDLVAAKRFADALRVANAAVKLPSRHFSNDVRGLLLYNQGLACLELSMYDHAVRIVREAKKLRNDPNVCQVLGIALRKLERWVESIREQECYFALNRRPDPIDYYWMIRSLDRAGQLQQAAVWADRAVAVYPGDQQLRKEWEQCRNRLAIEGGMQKKLVAPRFELSFDRRIPAQQAWQGKILKMLFDAYLKVSGTFDFYYDKTIQVVVYPTEGAYRSASGAPTWSGGQYDGKIRIPLKGTATSDEELGSVVVHEFTHLVVDKLSNGVCPAWLNEGLAQIEERRDMTAASELMKRYLADETLRRHMFGLAQMERSFSEIPDKDQANLAYAEAYFVTKFVLGRWGGPRVRKLLETMAAGKKPPEAVAATLGVDYGALQTAWLQHEARGLGLE